MKRHITFNFLKKHKSLLACVFLATTLSSCEVFDLDEETPSKSELEIRPYATIDELELGVNGIYGQLRSAAWMTTFYVNGWSGDDMTTHKASNKADFREYDQRSVTSLNSRTADNWGAVYSMVRAANTVFQNIENITFENDIEKQNSLIGETYFLRAIMMHHLVRIHGEIPIILKVDPTAKSELSSTQDVYAQIESDLLEAEKLLPDTTTPGTTRPSAGSARAILARLYLDWAGYPVKDNTKYAQAASSAKTVIDKAGTFGFGLEEDVASLWTEANRFNSESLYTIAYCNSCGVPNRKNGKLGIPGDGSGWQETFAEIRFFEDFPEGPRKEATYYTSLPIDDDGKVTFDASKATGELPWTEFKDQQNPLFRKIIGPFEEGAGAVFETGRSDYFMRYAELLLIYAEASGEAGDGSNAEAWEALNLVRRRAAGVTDNSVDVSDADGTLQDLAYLERKWELAGEYLRWNDLVRKEKVAEALGGDARNPQVSIGTEFDTDGNGTPKKLTGPSNAIQGSTGTDNYFAPIPQNELDFNPELKDKINL